MPLSATSTPYDAPMSARPIRLLPLLLCVSVLAACTQSSGTSTTASTGPGTTSSAATTTVTTVAEEVTDPDDGPLVGPIRLIPREPGAADVALVLVPVNAPETLSYPVAMEALPGSDDFLVVERWGRLRVMAPNGTVSAPLLDVAESVLGEENAGMLGLAIHPDFGANGLVYLHTATRDGFDRVVEYEIRGQDAVERRILLEVFQGSAAHQGGAMHFGPDGFLYVGLGDGGVESVSSDPTDPRGAIVRVDVDGDDEPVVWISGVRNPYQFWFDLVEDRLIVPDPGVASVEELNVVPLSVPFADLGWPAKEGLVCRTADHRIATGGCGGPELVDPVLVYFHGAECAIIGGPAYRGESVDVLGGRILFSDFCNRWIRAAAVEDGVLIDTLMWTPEDAADLDVVVAFARDAAGEVYVLTGPRGLIYRIEQAD